MYTYTKAFLYDDTIPIQIKAIDNEDFENGIEFINIYAYETMDIYEYFSDEEIDKLEKFARNYITFNAAKEYKGESCNGML